MKKATKLFLTILIPITIYIPTICYSLVYMNIIIPSVESSTDNDFIIFFVEFFVNFLIELLVIILPTILIVKKSRTITRVPIISVIIMYILFAIYAPPSAYLFVVTYEWGGGIFPTVPAMPYWQASIFITLQYGIVMLITMAITNAIRKRKANVKNIADVQAENSTPVEQASESNAEN